VFNARVNRLLGLAATAAAVMFLSLPAGADAASRGFHVINNSQYSLQLVNATPEDNVICGGYDETSFGCVPANFDMEFEGRPANGSILAPGGMDDWELEYTYNVGDLFGADYNYVAVLNYMIVGTSRPLTLRIATSNYVNDSFCVYVPKRLGGCSPQGLEITIG
jgi:hypothetical protein